MKSLFILCLIFLSGNSLPISDNQLDQSWAIFKNVFHKTYSSIEEELDRCVDIILKEHHLILFLSSRQIWESSIQLINEHNLENDLGLNSYRLGMNQFGDMVRIDLDRIVSMIDQ